MSTGELGVHGGVANRAFKLKGQEFSRGMTVPADVLDGLPLRTVRSLQGSGLVTYFNKAGDAKSHSASEKKPAKAPKPKKARK